MSIITSSGQNLFWRQEVELALAICSWNFDGMMMIPMVVDMLRKLL